MNQPLQIETACAVCGAPFARIDNAAPADRHADPTTCLEILRYKVGVYEDVLEVFKPIAWGADVADNTRVVVAFRFGDFRRVRSALGLREGNAPRQYNGREWYIPGDEPGKPRLRSAGRAETW